MTDLERYRALAHILLTRHGLITDNMADGDLLDQLEHLVALNALQIASTHTAQANTIVEALELLEPGDVVHVGREPQTGRPWVRHVPYGDGTLEDVPAHRGSSVRDALAQVATVLRLGEADEGGAR